MGSAVNQIIEAQLSMRALMRDSIKGKGWSAVGWQWWRRQKGVYIRLRAA